MRNLLYLFIAVLSFAPCDKRICVDVPIVDDEIVENDESFEVTLQRPPGLDTTITLAPVDGVVEISENDGKYDDYMVVTEVTHDVTKTYFYNHAFLGLLSILWIIDYNV